MFPMLDFDKYTDNLASMSVLCFNNCPEKIAYLNKIAILDLVYK